ncbi:metallo-beta-lactamase domain-containing protein 1-like [Branchiostoma floridae x Branchiostoma japonicum]
MLRGRIARVLISPPWFGIRGVTAESAQLNRLLLKMPVYRKVPFPVQEKLQRELDKDLATRNNWFKLAKILGYDEDYISIFEKQKSPSEAMFNEWKTKNENTVEKLVDALRQMRRDDVIEILEGEKLVPVTPSAAGPAIATATAESPTKSPTSLAEVSPGLPKPETGDSPIRNQPMQGRQRRTAGTKSYQVIVLKEGYAYADGPGCQRADGSITLVKGTYNVIVDTGNPWDKQHILDGLQRNGLSPGDIQFVVCTHGHSDHVGNLNLFTKATHIVSYDISKMDKYTVHNFTGDQKSPFRIDDHIEVIATPGHTHSDVSVVVKNTDQGTVVIAGDLFECEEDLSCDRLWQEYSENKEMQEHHRQQVLEMADWIVPGHGRMFAVPEKYKGGL